MYSLRVKDVQAAVAKAVNQCQTSLTIILDYINRATERLLFEGKWKGTVQTFRLCVDSNKCIVWPREIETIEAIAVCRTPYPIRTEWYEFNENGPGIVNEDACLSGTLIDRGEVPAFDEVVGTGKKIAVYCDRTENAGKFIWLNYYTKDGQWATSQVNGEIVDGEQISIPTTAGTYVYTASEVRAGGLIRVRKDITFGVVRLYEFNTVTAAIKPLAYYQPDEEVPVYRRSLIPDLDDDACDQKQVTVRAKLRFIPARTAESFVMIGHREAIRLACKAIKMEEDDRIEEAAHNWAIALRLLNKQLSHFSGDGATPALQFASSGAWGGRVTHIQ